jgi:hypothetical protein
MKHTTHDFIIDEWCRNVWRLKIFNFLLKLKSLLNPGGQILLDSSDIIYMFDDDEDGEMDSIR